MDTLNIINAGCIGQLLGMVPTAIGAMVGGASTPVAVAATVINPVVVLGCFVAGIVAASIHRTYIAPPAKVVPITAARSYRRAR